MNLWQKLTGNSKSDEPEIYALEQELGKLKYHARPEFQNDLKARLLASLENQSLAAPDLATKPKLKFWQNPAWGRLAFGGFAVAALLVLMVSVLTVNNPSADSPTSLAQQTTLQTIPTVTPAANTAPEFSPQQAAPFAPLLFNPLSKNYIKAEEASRQLGFAVRPPSYLPAGYNFSSATLQLPDRPPMGMPMLRGYQLNYNAPEKNKKMRELLLGEWEAPFFMRGGPNSRFEPFSGISGAKVTPVEIAPALTGFYLEGPRWRLNFSPRAAEDVPLNLAATPASVEIGEAVSTLPERSPRPNVAPANPPQPNDVAVSVARAGGNRSEVALEFGNKPVNAKVKTLIWQQNNRLLIVSGDESLTLAELKKVAIGFLAGR